MTKQLANILYQLSFGGRPELKASSVASMVKGMKKCGEPVLWKFYHDKRRGDNLTMVPCGSAYQDDRDRMTENHLVIEIDSCELISGSYKDIILNHK